MLGVTGMIGSGKSTAVQILQNLGALKISSDELARKYTDPNSPVQSELVQMFGSDILDSSGNLDRKQIAKLVFPNPDLLKSFNALVHPKIRKDFLDFRDKAPKGSVLAWEAPLLFEAKGDELCNATLFIDIPLDSAWKNVEKRGGMDRKDWEFRIASQMSREEKKSRADFTILNDTDIENLQNKLKRLFAEILSHRRNS